MKKILLLAIALVACASVAFAQTGGHIGIYSDNPGFSDCYIVEGATTPMKAYVVHTNRTQANTSQFMVLNTWAAFPGAVAFGANLFIGSTANNTIYEGGTVTYVGCKPLPHLLCTLDFFFGGVFTPACGVVLEIVPDPTLASGQIEVVDCSFGSHFGTGGKMFANVVNPQDCPCIVATEETSWSRVKALYK